MRGWNPPDSMLQRADGQRLGTVRDASALLLLLLALLLPPCHGAERAGRLSGHAAAALDNGSGGGSDTGGGHYSGCRLGWRPYQYTLPNSTCLPSWQPTFGMRNSTVLYTCNNSGLHDVRDAARFGVIVYDCKSIHKAVVCAAVPSFRTILSSLSVVA